MSLFVIFMTDQGIPIRAGLQSVWPIPPAFIFRRNFHLLACGTDPTSRDPPTIGFAPGRPEQVDLFHVLVTGTHPRDALPVIRPRLRKPSENTLHLHLQRGDSFFNFRLCHRAVPKVSPPTHSRFGREVRFIQLRLHHIRRVPLLFPLTPLIRRSVLSVDDFFSSHLFVSLLSGTLLV